MLVRSICRWNSVWGTDARCLGKVPVAQHSPGGPKGRAWGCCCFLVGHVRWCGMHCVLRQALRGVSLARNGVCRRFVGWGAVPFAAISSLTKLECSGHPLWAPVVLQSAEGFSGREEIVCSHADGCRGSGWSHEVWCREEDMSAAGMTKRVGNGPWGWVVDLGMYVAGCTSTVPSLATSVVSVTSTRAPR